METIITAFAFISLQYIVSMIFCTYLTIQLINSLRKIGISTSAKRLISLLVGLILGVAYVNFKLAELDNLIPSFFVAIVGYDYFIKNALNKLKGLNNKK